MPKHIIFGLLDLSHSSQTVFDRLTVDSVHLRKDYLVKKTGINGGLISGLWIMSGLGSMIGIVLVCTI